MRFNYAIMGLALASYTLGIGSTHAGTLRYSGLCEASAAVAIDENHFAVASDDSEKIRLYKHGEANPLANVFRHAGVTDIEAAARIGDVVLWLTSHSLNKNGKDKPERKELFATRIAGGPTLVEAGTTYRNLREDIASAITEKDPSFVNDFNIEGLASTPANTILVGLRGPVEQPQPGRAYVVEIDHPLGLVGVDGPAAEPSKIVNVFHLRLFDGDESVGRGARSIERVGDRYLIVGGSVPDGRQPPPRLFWWDGINENNVTPAQVVDFSEIVPEAMIAWSDKEVDILGDNGDAVIGGEECDDKHDEPAGAWFPSVQVRF